MPTTTNFGWTTPADTDLVKDGASAMRTLGNGIDTSLVYLKGGTTGQILSKTSNTDMAFTWINNDQGDLTAITAGTGISVTSGTGPIPTVAIDTATTVDKTTAQTLTNKTISGSSNTISNVSLTTGVTGTLPVGNGGTNLTTYTTGDLPYASATNTLSKLAVGTSGQVLTVSGGVPTWAAAASGSTYVGVSVYKSANQSINSATWTVLTFDSEDWDTDAFHSTSSNTSRLTVPTGKGGKYGLTGVLSFEPFANWYGLEIRKNGTTFINYAPVLYSASGGDYTYTSFAYTLNLVAGDYIELRAYQASGAAKNVMNTYTTVQMNYLGA